MPTTESTGSALHAAGWRAPKIAAIKAFREVYPCNLVDSRHAVEAVLSPSIADAARLGIVVGHAEPLVAMLSAGGRAAVRDTIGKAALAAEIAYNVAVETNSRIERAAGLR